MTQPHPLLTIAIPTWKRAEYLALNLDQLALLLKDVPQDSVEILVSDNASPDETPAIIARAINAGMPLTSIRNAENIGSDANIAQCFNRAAGKYVLILGDDDLLVDGALTLLLDRLRQENYGTVVLRPYGYDHDFRAEFPGGAGDECVYDNMARFLAHAGPLVTLISGCIVNKSLLPMLDASIFCGGNLVQVHLVFLAALAAKKNLFLNKYLVACKRNNSGGYDFSSVFVTSFSAVLDAHRKDGLTQNSIDAVENRFLLGYYPQYLLQQRMNRSGDLRATAERFRKRFGARILFKYWIAPILYLPRPLAILWGMVATFLGRVLCGDLRRGLMFAFNKFRR